MVSVTRLGVAIRAGSVSMIALRDDAIVWAGAGSFDELSELESTLVELLKQVPLSRWIRTRAVAAVSPSRCQTRAVVGLPPVRDAAVASALIRENVSRFFLRNGVPLTTARAIATKDGVWWSAAFEEPVVDVVRSACAKSRIKVEAFVPTIAVLSPRRSTSEIIWPDATVTTLARFDDGRLIECQRIGGDAGAAHNALVPTALDALGAEAPFYVDAYAAAIPRSLREIPTLSGTTQADRDTVPPWRMTIAALAACAACVAGFLGPPLHARFVAEHAQREANRLERIEKQALVDEADLARFRAVLAEFKGLATSSTRPVARLISTLASSLPDSAAIVSVRVDTLTAQIVVLAPRAATVLTRLERSRVIANPRIVGPITREKVAGREAERVIVRFERR